MVVAEILANQLVVILNKIDMLPQDKRKKILEKVMKELRKARPCADRFTANIMRLEIFIIYNVV